MEEVGARRNGLNDEGHVYFVCAPTVKLIKIGFAIDPEKRFKALRCGSPVALEKLALRRGTKSLEYSLHSRFRSLRDHDEWFRDTRELRAYIRENATNWAQFLEEEAQANMEMAVESLGQARKEESAKRAGVAYERYLKRKAQKGEQG